MDIRLIGGDQAAGVVAGAEAAIDGSRGAQRASLSPIDVRDLQGNMLGHYRTVCISGSMVSIGAGGVIFSCRWAGPLPPVAVITRISVCVEVLTAITVATPMNFEAIGYKGYTSSDTGGGVVIPTKMRSNHSASSFADFRMCTTAALGAGTRTVDSVGFGYAGVPLLTNVSATGTAVLVTAGNGYPPVDIYKWEPGGHPFVLGVAEGFAVRQSVAPPVTGTYRVTLIIEHIEAAAF